MLNNNNIERVVILGHTGFIGKHLENFFKKKYPEVIGKSLPDFDLTKDFDSLKDIFDTKTAVIMCSAIKKDHGDNIDNFSINVNMVVNVCKILETNPVKNFVYFSSAAVYGEDIHNLQISEKTAINPTSYYGMAKYVSERLLWEVSKNNLIIMRPPVIYGPGDKPCYGPSGFVNAALNNETVTLWGDGTEKREFIFIEDIVQLIDKLIINNYNGELNLASGKSSTFKEIIDIVSSLTNSNIEVNSRERTKDKVDNVFDNSELLKIFPGFTFTPLMDGIKKTIESVKVI